MLDSILRTTSRWPLARLHGGVRLVEPLMRSTYRRKVVEDNLRRAFPDDDTARLVREFYSGFCQASVEVVRSLGMDATELGERVTFEGTEVLDEGNALLLMAHHGNLIWAVTALASQVEAPVAIVYKPPHTPAVREHLLAVAARFGVTLVPVKDMRRELLKRRRERPVWTLVADQRPGGRDRHTVEFCGRETAFFAGPERLAKALRWPVYYLSCQRVRPGRYHCRIEKIADPPHDRRSIVEGYVANLQADIDRAPADWLWSHKRWRD
ncbi:MAG: lysophospholipid acyltransferase family protein [Gammaproteobacteria bacterium]|nr:lysophospholipid acyltransferase family protein [Gammaproteobacteria bacterium]